jgi:DNA polymerase-3 subunit chi
VAAAGTEVGFYQLHASPLERALPRLVERALAGGFRVLIRCGSRPRLDQLNDVLWTYDPGSFLPHGGSDDGNAAGQPIYLSETADNPNGADLLVLIDGVEAEDLDHFRRCLDLFDGNDADALAAARRRWRALKDHGFRLTSWAQGDDGRWQEKG